MNSSDQSVLYFW